MKYKNSQLFWGFLLITFGILFLLDKNNLLLALPEDITDYWPVLVILWGIAIIIKESVLKPITAIASGIFVALSVYSFIFGFTSSKKEEGTLTSKITSKTFFENYNENTEYATLSLRTGAGKIKLNNITDKLIEGTSSGNHNELSFKTRYRENRARVVLRYIQNEINLLKDDLRDLEIKLNPNPIWKLDLEIGAASINMDLSDFKVSEFNLETGASTSEIRFGNKLNNVKINIEIGAATLKIDIPETSACEIKGDMAMMIKNLDGFTKVNNKRFRTENFDTATNKIYVNIDGGIATFEINRY